MATWTSRTVEVRRHEWVVPCYGEGVWDGSAAVELEKAVEAARQHAYAAGVEMYDDVVRVRPGSGEVIVYWVDERAVPAVAPSNASTVAELAEVENELATLVGSSGVLHPTTLAHVESLLGKVQRLIRRGDAR